MSFFVIDVEADGPYCGDYSMVSFGAVVVEPSLSKTFYGEVCPITNIWVPEALAISGKKREEHEAFPMPEEVMPKFIAWVKEVSVGRPIFISDNPCFDWMFMCYYLHKFGGENPFGYSGRRIGDLYCGLQKNAYAQWKFLRKTKHTHHPVQDATGNAEVILHMRDNMGLEIGLK